MGSAPAARRAACALLRPLPLDFRRTPAGAPPAAAAPSVAAAGKPAAPLPGEGMPGRAGFFDGATAGGCSAGGDDEPGAPGAPPEPRGIALPVEAALPSDALLATLASPAAA